MQSGDLLECPVCMEEMKPPKKIFQCSNGHAFCEQCKINPALTSCPICRIQFTDSNVSRNILAEAFASQATSNRTTITKDCPVCNQTFGQNVPQYVFEEHVQEHFNSGGHQQQTCGPREQFNLGDQEVIIITSGGPAAEHQGQISKRNIKK